MPTLVEIIATWNPIFFTRKCQTILIRSIRCRPPIYIDLHLSQHDIRAPSVLHRVRKPTARVGAGVRAQVRLPVRLQRDHVRRSGHLRRRAHRRPRARHHPGRRREKDVGFLGRARSRGAAGDVSAGEGRGLSDIVGRCCGSCRSRPVDRGERISFRAGTPLEKFVETLFVPCLLAK